MTVGAVVAAAGAGTRLGRGAKALLEVGGKTLLDRAVDLFQQVDEVDRVVVVVPPDRLEEARARLAGRMVTVVAGGETRQESVREGLAALAGVDHVLVHDAARPLASPRLVMAVLAAAVADGAAIPGLPPRDAVKRVEAGRVVESLDRNRLLLAQTPQAFSYPLLVKAHFDARDAGVAGDDDAQLVAAGGHPVRVVPGEPENIKVTTAADLELVDSLLRERDPV